MGATTTTSVTEVNLWIYFHDKVVESAPSIITYRQQSRWLNAISVSISLPSGDLDAQQHTLSTIVSDIQSIPVVKRVEEVNEIKSATSHSRVAKQTLKNLQNINNSSTSTTKSSTIINGIDYGHSYDQLNQISIIKAHQLGYTGNGVKILIIDSGFYKSHESLQNCTIAGERDFIDQDFETQGPLGDPQNSHGTFILSNLAGWKPGKIIGAAHGAKYYLAKTEIVKEEKPVEEDYFISALEWGESMGVDIVTASLGYSDWYKYWDMNGGSPISRAVDMATDKGVLVIISGGNNGPGGLSPPADAAKCISVGAVDSNGAVASFSAVGPTSDGRLKPEVVASGVFNYAASSEAVDSYAYPSGTSLSAPLIAGSAALVLEAHPEWSPATVKEALFASAPGVGNPDNYIGYGIVNTIDAIHYKPNTCSSPCSGVCVDNVCHCANTGKHEDDCLPKVPCGFVCKVNGGKCSPYNCFECINPAKSVKPEKKPLTCDKVNQQQLNGSTRKKINYSLWIYYFIAVVLLV
eukprot:gene12846-15084_t